ncbi:DMT family transporter [Alphaproteobacteria bacterium LSUCC0719]|jgi:drug/metabolite transporter (DMT)-like permease
MCDMILDRPIIGIAFMLGFCVFAPMGDAAAKSIALATPLLVLLLARYLTQWLLPLPLIMISGRTLKMTSKVARIILARSVVHIAGVAVMFTAYRYLPLADALAIAFVFPFIMLVMGRFFLDEQVGIRRLGACTVGFLGTLLIIQPSFAAVGLPALLPLIVAFLFALLVLLTRQIAKDYDPVCLQSASGLVSAVILMLAWALTRHLQIFDLQLVMPTSGQAQTLALVGVFGTLAHLGMTYAVRFAPSATLAPMQYIELPIATVIGWVMFNELPNGLAAVGITITILAGLAVIYFEHRALAREAHG